MTARRRFGSLRKLPSGRWQVRYLGPDGGTRVAPTTFATKTEAALYLAAVEVDMARGTWLDPVRGEVRLREYAEAWIAQRRCAAGAGGSDFGHLSALAEGVDRSRARGRLGWTDHAGSRAHVARAGLGEYRSDRDPAGVRAAAGHPVHRGRGRGATAQSLLHPRRR